MRRRALVIGGSLGGLFAARLLQKQGWRVDVYERAVDDLAGRGAGIGTHDELFDVLRRLGVAIDEGFGVRVSERICLDVSGRAIHRTRWDAVMTHWARIYRAMKDQLSAAHYHPGKNFSDFSREGGEIVAHFDDGSQARADFLIGADGLRSTVRARLFAEAQPRYAGYVGWRGIVQESALPLTIRKSLATAYYFVLPPSEMMLCYPVPGMAQREWNYVWYRPASVDGELRDLCTDSSGHDHGTAIPPPLVRPELARKLKDAATAILAPQMAAIVELSQPFFQAIFDLESPRMHDGRVILLGDAAFVARPHVGMGVTKAALDALCLARSLELAEDDLDDALARYDELRSEFGRRCVRRAQRIGAYIEGRTPALDQSPARILAEVGAPLSNIPELALEI
jgi:2-polyprenyl-6-methoxyphenol hydroxylase-like FAD-dependent oxidoreductase